MKLPDQRGFPVLVPVVLKDRPTGRLLSERIEQTETGTDLIPLEFPHCILVWVSIGQRMLVVKQFLFYNGFNEGRGRLRYCFCNGSV